MANIVIDGAALEKLNKEFATKGEKYKSNLRKFDKLMTDITKGDITGDPANDLLAKYEKEKAKFNNIAKSLDDAKVYIEAKLAEFNDLINQ